MGMEIPGVTEDGEGNIWVAASDGRVDLVEHFLQFGGSDGNSMDVNSKDDSGYTPLHAAAAYAHLDLIRLLVEKYKADVNITDDDGDTPLHVCETVAAAKLLVELGADPKRANEEGQLPIDLADEEENTELVEYLMQYTPDYTPAERVDDMEALAHVLGLASETADDEDANSS